MPITITINIDPSSYVMDPEGIKEKIRVKQDLVDKLNFNIARESINIELEHMKEYYKEAVDDFYNDPVFGMFGKSTTPEFYIRETDDSCNLYGLLDIKRDDLSYEAFYTDDKFTTDNNGKSLFEKVFVNGYHGGAEHDYKHNMHPNDGVPYYRTPPPSMIRGKARPWIKWGIPAIKASVSPQEAFESKWNQYIESGEQRREFETILNKYLRAYKPLITRE